MLIYITIAIVAFLLGGFLCRGLLEKSIRTTQEYDKKTAEANEVLKKQNQELACQAQQLTENLTNLQLNEQKYLGRISALETSTATAEQQAKDAADRFYKSNMKIAIEHLNQSLEEESKNYTDSIQAFKDQLITIQAEETQQLNEQLKLKQKDITSYQSILDDLQAKVAAAIAAAKRQEEIKEKTNFYRIQLTDINIEEIEKLRDVEPFLRNKEPLNKVIWKVYYEKPTNDLIGRVIGSGIHTGIYKITHIESNKCYVGQAIDLASRWKQHIKRGVGAEAPTRNKLYPAMIEYGPENFTFEIIEECDKSLLDSREDYWQDYFKAKEFGYSIK